MVRLDQGTAGALGRGIQPSHIPVREAGIVAKNNRATATERVTHRLSVYIWRNTRNSVASFPC
jgi:hypothetical protein